VVKREKGDYRMWSPELAALKAMKGADVVLAKIGVVVNGALAGP